MKRVSVFLATGFEEIEAVSIIDILRRAGAEVSVISVTGLKVVEGSHFIKITADGLFESVSFENTDMLVLPGGMPGAKNLAAHSGLTKLITAFNSQEKFLGAICAAPLVFGQLGILENREATCFPGFEAYLKGAKLSNLPVVADGNIVTGKGAGVAVLFALKLVEKLSGKSVADSLKEKMFVP